MSIKKIDTIIFDMGNVLMSFEPETFLSRAGVEDKADRQLLLDVIFKSKDWPRLDTGEWDEKDLEECAKSKLPTRLHEAAGILINRWDDPIIPVTGMEELVKKCKDSGFRLLLLSNASRRQHEYWERVPGHQYFEDTVISADVRMVKPDKDIFTYTIEKFNLNPSSCLFVDDVESNLAGAQSVGINTFLFKKDAASLERYIWKNVTIHS